MSALTYLFCTGSCTQLTDIRISNNNLTGLFPPSFGLLKNIKVLIVSHNQLIGPIPSVGTLKNMEVCDLGHNKFQGPIPLSFGSLHSIRELDLSFNNLTGELPPCLGTLCMVRISVRSNFVAFVRATQIHYVSQSAEKSIPRSFAKYTWYEYCLISENC